MNDDSIKTKISQSLLLIQSVLDVKEKAEAEKKAAAEKVATEVAEKAAEEVKE